MTRPTTNGSGWTPTPTNESTSSPISHTDARCAACDLRPFPYRKRRANPVNAPTGFVIVIGIPTNECALLNGFATITGHGHISESGETKTSSDRQPHWTVVRQDISHQPAFDTTHQIPPPPNRQEPIRKTIPTERQRLLSASHVRRAHVQYAFTKKAECRNRRCSPPPFTLQSHIARLKANHVLHRNAYQQAYTVARDQGDGPLSICKCNVLVWFASLAVRR